ncbi:hypothetical protein [Azospirillum sp. SYSU D00513]|uniref:NrdR family transcriptional regulator n=1 Tax=Azospirillum sp. SYSU D00513 TaxID=2812561 RepID=UPI001A9611C9|nr:hypothetical protein [Azospirillum sp. SYSU D00513]
MAGNDITLARISGRSKPSPTACPTCGSTRNGVVETRGMADNSIRRKRQCATCEQVWLTVERSIPAFMDDEVQLRPEALGGQTNQALPLVRNRQTRHRMLVPFGFLFPWMEPQERELLLLFRQASAQDRGAILAMAEAFAPFGAAGTVNELGDRNGSSDTDTREALMEDGPLSGMDRQEKQSSVE